MVNRITLTAITCLLTVANVEASEGWYGSYDEARSVAEQQGLPLLIHFHASYCGPCRQMTAVVFSRSDIQQQLRQGIAAVEIDVQHRPDLAAKYGATTVPCDVVVFPGQVVEKVSTGFKSAPAYGNVLSNIARRGATYAKVETQEPISSKPMVVKPSVKQLKTRNQGIVGLEGFCPVQLMKAREWIAGQSGLTESYRGITYNFSSEVARGEFRRDPRKYTPQNLGCDPVTLYADQQAITGEIKYGAFFDSQLFLFESSENRKAFKENPLKYGRIRHALKVDDLGSRIQ